MTPSLLAQRLKENGLMEEMAPARRPAGHGHHHAGAAARTRLDPVRARQISSWIRRGFQARELSGIPDEGPRSISAIGTVAAYVQGIPREFKVYRAGTRVRFLGLTAPEVNHAGMIVPNRQELTGEVYELVSSRGQQRLEPVFQLGPSVTNTEITDVHFGLVMRVGSAVMGRSRATYLSEWEQSRLASAKMAEVMRHLAYNPEANTVQLQAFLDGDDHVPVHLVGWLSVTGTYTFKHPPTGAFYRFDPRRGELVGPTPDRRPVRLGRLAGLNAWYEGEREPALTPARFDQLFPVRRIKLPTRRGGLEYLAVKAMATDRALARDEPLPSPVLGEDVLASVAGTFPGNSGFQPAGTAWEVRKAMSRAPDGTRVIIYEEIAGVEGMPFRVYNGIHLGGVVYFLHGGPNGGLVEPVPENQVTRRLLLRTR